MARGRIAHNIHIENIHILVQRFHQYEHIAPRNLVEGTLAACTRPVGAADTAA